MKLAFEVTRTVSKQPTGIHRYANQLIDASAAEAIASEIELFYKLPRLAKRKYRLRSTTGKRRIERIQRRRFRK